MAVGGVLLLDKDVGLSSNHALQRAKRLLGASKGGHSGTLDPLASGLLPLCFGEATKFAQYLLDAPKTYLTTLHLGIQTASGDRDGAVVAVSDRRPDLADVEAALTAFRGVQTQIPPMYSALKVGGRKLYQLARAGEEVERQPRHINIVQLDLLRYQYPEVDLRVHCSKGTYIRVLGEDIGRWLGCHAHLSALRRTETGHLTLDGAVTLAQLEQDAPEQRLARLYPADLMIQALPPLQVSVPDGRRWQMGQAVMLAPGDGSERRMYDDSGRFLGIAEWQESGRLLAVRAMAMDASS